MKSSILEYSPPKESNEYDHLLSSTVVELPHTEGNKRSERGDSNSEDLEKLKDQMFETVNKILYYLEGNFFEDDRMRNAFFYTGIALLNLLKNQERIQDPNEEGHFNRVLEYRQGLLMRTTPGCTVPSNEDYENKKQEWHRVRELEFSEELTYFDSKELGYIRNTCERVFDDKNGDDLENIFKNIFLPKASCKPLSDSII